MPFYDYRCPACGDFVRLRPMAQREHPCPCPACGKDSARVQVAAPALGVLAPALRKAGEVNERARHEPRHARGHVHGPGCGCGSAAPQPRSLPGRRPWMISH